MLILLLDLITNRYSERGSGRSQLCAKQADGRLDCREIALEGKLSASHASMIQALYWTGLCMLILFLPRSIPRCSQVALLDNAEPQLLLHFAPGPIQDPHQLPAHPFVVAPTAIRPFQSRIPNRDGEESQSNALITRLASVPCLPPDVAEAVSRTAVFVPDSASCLRSQPSRKWQG